MRAGAACLAALALWGAAVWAQRPDAFGASRDHPAIAYSTAPVDNLVTRLNAELRAGRRTFRFAEGSGYLRSVLEALDVPVESQVLSYAQTSFQARHISRANPRAIFFTDSVAVAWVRGGDVIEVAVQDPRLGSIFYTLTQAPSDSPEFVRNDGCLACHLTWETRAVPGLFIQTVFPRRSEEEYANGGFIDHRAPFAERWGGWFVTGIGVPPSMANMELLQPDMPESGPIRVPSRRSLDGLVDLAGYPRATSDVVALMVLDHQVHAANLITRAGWEHRIGSPHVRAAVEELVDYLLFVDEPPLPGPVKGTSGFTEAFAARGPRDARGRSLREFDLTARLFRYPLSYMIYSEGFRGLPPEVKAMIAARLDAILEGRVRGEKYAHLTEDTRRALAEILRDTLALTPDGAAGARARSRR
jgi:hypothetical protein